MSRCLIVEEALLIRQVMRAILSDCGFEVAEAARAGDGLVLFYSDIPDIAIVDAGLKDMPALDVLRHMRGAAKGTRLIYCTQQFDILELQRAHAAGAADVLVKPFDRAAFVAKLALRAPADPREAHPVLARPLSVDVAARI